MNKTCSYCMLILYTVTVTARCFGYTNTKNYMILDYYVLRGRNVKCVHCSASICGMRSFPHFGLLLAACCFVCAINETKSVDNRTKVTEKSEDGTPSSGNGLSTLSVVVLVSALFIVPVVGLSTFFITIAVSRRMHKTKAKEAAKGEDVGVHAPQSMELRSFDFEQKDDQSRYQIRKISEDTPPEDTLHAIPSIINYEKATVATQPATQPANVVKG